MKKKIITILLPIIIVALVILLSISLSNKKRNNNANENSIKSTYEKDYYYEEGFFDDGNDIEFELIDKDELSYEYYFEGYYDDFLKYFINPDDKEIYLRINTYYLNLVPSFLKQNFGKNKPPTLDSVVNSILEKDGDILLELKEDEYKEFEQARYTKDDCIIYLKLKNANCNRIVFKLRDITKSYLPTSRYTLKDIAKQESNYFNNDYFIYKTIANKGKYGLIDKDGNLIMDFISYNEILTNTAHIAKKYYRVIITQEDGLQYLADMKGNILSDGYPIMYFYRSGYGATIEDSHRTHQGIVDFNGNLIIPTNKYVRIELVDYNKPSVEMYICQTSSLSVVDIINSKGEVIHSCDTSTIGIKKEHPLILHIYGKKYTDPGYDIDENGNVL